MKTKLILCLMAMLMLNNFQANSKNAADYFIDMPLLLIPTLESSYRVELIENYLTEGKDSLQNRFGTNVKLLHLDTINQHIALQTTSNARFELQLIENENDTLIGVINTVCAPICSSYIKFYDTEWKEVKVDFPKFSNNSWSKVTTSDEAKKNAEQLVKMSMIELIFNPAENKVEAINNTPEILSEEDRASLTDDMITVNLYVPFSKLVKRK